MRKKKHKVPAVKPLYLEKHNPKEKLYGYVIDVDDMITMHDDTQTEDVSYIDVTNERNLLK